MIVLTINNLEKKTKGEIRIQNLSAIHRAVAVTLTEHQYSGGTSQRSHVKTTVDWKLIAKIRQFGLILVMCIHLKYALHQAFNDKRTKSFWLKIFLLLVAILFLTNSFKHWSSKMSSKRQYKRKRGSIWATQHREWLRLLSKREALHNVQMFTASVQPYQSLLDSQQLWSRQRWRCPLRRWQLASLWWHFSCWWMRLNNGMW